MTSLLQEVICGSTGGGGLTTRLRLSRLYVTQNVLMVGCLYLLRPRTHKDLL